MNEIKEDAVKAVWRSQPVEAATMSIAYVRHRASELERAFRVRSLLEQGVGLLVLIWCAYVIVVAPHLWIKAGVALLLAGIAYSMVQWRRRATPNKTQAFESVDASLVFYKRELERKRDFHRTLWRWYMLPMTPGILAILAWGFIGDQHTRGTWTPWVVTTMLLIWTVLTLIYEHVKSAQCQREIDALSSLGRDAG